MLFSVETLSQPENSARAWIDWGPRSGSWYKNEPKWRKKSENIHNFSSHVKTPYQEFFRLLYKNGEGGEKSMTKMENGIFNTPVLAKFKINSSELYFSLLIMNLLIDWKKVEWTCKLVIFCFELIYRVVLAFRARIWPSNMALGISPFLFVITIYGSTFCVTTKMVICFLSFRNTCGAFEPSGGFYLEQFCVMVLPNGPP